VECVEERAACSSEISVALTIFFDSQANPVSPKRGLAFLDGGMDGPNSAGTVVLAVQLGPLAASESIIRESRQIIVRKSRRRALLLRGERAIKPRSWTVDTSEQRATMLRDDNPDPASLLCVHIYYPGVSAVADAMAAARSVGKPLFIGEFGGANRNEFTAMLAAVEEAKVPLAAFWVYDHGLQDESCNATWTNHRAYQLQTIVEANARIRNELDAEGSRSILEE
jgi:hypothetical protein